MGAQSSVPQLFDVSPDQKYTIEVGASLDAHQKAKGQSESNVVLLRDLISNKIVARFEGHSQSVSNISFVERRTDNPEQLDLAFLSCTSSGECLLWEVPPLGNKVQEVLQPAKILDIECADSIGYVTGCQVMQGAYLVTAISERRQFVFLTKASKRQRDGSTKAKVKRVDTVVTLAEQSHEIVYTTIVGDSQIQTIYGNVLSLMQASFNIVEEAKPGSDGDTKPSILKSI